MDVGTTGTAVKILWSHPTQDRFSAASQPLWNLHQLSPQRLFQYTSIPRGGVRKFGLRALISRAPMRRSSRISSAVNSSLL